jgi:BASS family bile acid:Na+ symporter
MWPAIVGLIGDFTLVAIIIFTLVSLALGHLLGGPDPDDRTVLGLSTASRHPGVAIAIASAIAPDKKAVAAVAAAVFLCVLVGVAVTVPYVRWRKRSHAAAA